MGEMITPHINPERMPRVLHSVTFELLNADSIELVGEQRSQQRKYAQDFTISIMASLMDSQRHISDSLSHRHETNRIITIMRWGISSLDLSFSQEAMLGQSTVLLVDYLSRYGVSKPIIVYAGIKTQHPDQQGYRAPHGQDYTLESQIIVDSLLDLTNTNIADLIN